VVSVAQAWIRSEGDTHAQRSELARFRQEFYTSLTLRADALFELTDAVLCADGPVRSLVDLTLVAEHRRGHGAMYDALNQGRVEPERIRRSLSSLPLPRATDGRLVLAVDVSPWLRSDAATSADRLFCHVHGRGKGQAQLIPGWPYSFVAALERGRTSWTALLDAIRLGPADDATVVTNTNVSKMTWSCVSVTMRCARERRPQAGSPHTGADAVAGGERGRIRRAPGGCRRLVGDGAGHGVRVAVSLPRGR